MTVDRFIERVCDLAYVEKDPKMVVGVAALLAEVAPDVIARDDWYSKVVANNPLDSIDFDD